jgi:hypothetical protein
VKLSPEDRLRQHPDDPLVWEITTDTATRMILGGPCRGCPYSTDQLCPAPEDERSCRVGTVWYGEHIFIANKLEGA